MTAPEASRTEFERLLEQHGGIVRKVAFGYARTETNRRDLMLFGGELRPAASGTFAGKVRELVAQQLDRAFRESCAGHAG